MRLNLGNNDVEIDIKWLINIDIWKSDMEKGVIEVLG